MSNRPVYETEADRIAEAAIKQMICDLWQCEAEKLPEFYELDFAIVRGRAVRGWVEVKRLKRRMDKWPNVYFPMQKVVAAYGLHQVSGLPCRYVVQFDDVLASADILRQRKTEFLGRDDRGDPLDRGAAVLIPAGDFRILKSFAEGTE